MEVWKAGRRRVGVAKTWGPARDDRTGEERRFPPFSPYLIPGIKQKCVGYELIRWANLGGGEP